VIGSPDRRDTVHHHIALHFRRSSGGTSFCDYLRRSLYFRVSRAPLALNQISQSLTLDRLNHQFRYFVDRPSPRPNIKLTSSWLGWNRGLSTKVCHLKIPVGEMLLRAGVSRPGRTNPVSLRTFRAAAPFSGLNPWHIPSNEVRVFNSSKFSNSCGIPHQHQQTPTNPSITGAY
jgi:hypothetical protein